jgi:predicted nuclease of predicted toxin-antitoxin system
MTRGVWLMFDSTIHYETYRTLANRGISCIHAGEEGLADSDAMRLLESAIEDECILVSRNYADFARLADALRRESRAFPGILLVGEELNAWDVEAEADAIEGWVAETTPEANRDKCLWLRLPRPETPAPSPPRAVVDG